MNYFEYMRKYWYYTYATANSVGDRVCYSDSGEFELCESIKILRNIYGVAIITSWHEISSIQYEKLKEYFDNKEK